MLSGEALDMAYILREQVGGLTQGDGPPLAVLREHTRLPEAEFNHALDELRSVGFIQILDGPERASPTVAVLAPLQIYLDDLESQGTDEF